MAIALVDRDTPATWYKDGAETVVIVGKRLKITTGTAPEDELLNWNIPASEVWEVVIQINAMRTA